MNTMVMLRWRRWLPALLVCLPLGPALALDIYSQETFRALASDVKAHRLGDVLTVLVTENATAITSADTSTSRESSGGADLLFRGRSREVGGSMSHDFEGNAKTQRAGRLLAQLSVTVVAVHPNGDVQVAGRQLLEINDEQQMISLEGRVRRHDIGDNNSVPSNRIADAVIQYAGDGVLSAGQRVGIVTRVLTWLGL
jgi:flagellar L-ring protein precursor FlgH